MTRELDGWIRPRPLRVAFLIEDVEHALLALDGIFADCYDRWGGRFSLIAPCIQGKISSAYWPWLQAYDPDIVYSYVPLNKASILEIHERLGPAKYIYHDIADPQRLDVHGFKPSYDFSPLSSLSVIFQLARYSSAGSQAPPISVIDSWHTEETSRFLTDNFGTYHDSRGGGIYPPDATAAAGLLTIVSPKYQEGKYGVPKDLNSAPNEMEALRQFASKKATSLSVLSTLFAPKLDIRDNRWSGSFNLVVGDTFADRILFWNARLLIPNWLDRDLCCFRVDPEQLKDVSLVANISNLINRHNHVNGGSGGQTQLTVRSASLTPDQLAEAYKLVAAMKLWSGVRSEAVVNLDEIVPTANSLKSSNQDDRLIDDHFRRPGWKRFTWYPPMVRPPAIAPNHLADAPVRQYFTEGYWCTDFNLEYDGPAPRLGQSNKWMLPRRWRMAAAFKTSFVGSRSFALPPPARGSRDGNLTIFVCSDHPIEAVEVPNAYGAVQHALTVDGAWSTAEDDEERIPVPAAKVLWTHPSNEARYLTGVLGMTGGLIRASNFLLHPFLQEIFASLGGTPNLPVDKITPTANRLRKRARSETAFDLKDEHETQALATLIGKAARDLKKPIDFVRFDDLKESWRGHRAAYWIKNPHPGETGDDVDWDGLEAATLESSFIAMRQRQMVFQGHQWTCPKCHHRNWVDLALLSSDLACKVCKKAVQAPVDIRWLFRPNEFLIESLRDHSVLSLIWTLTALRQRARRSFIFVEPTWFGFSRDTEGPEAEADLLVILDGEAVLCEVKSSWHSLRQSHVDDFVALAIRLRPNTALLAVMEEGINLENKLSAARAELESAGIKFELLTANTFKVEDDPYLYRSDIDEDEI